jgi:hypothetical protein
VGVGDVERRTEVAIERLQLGEREWIIEGGSWACGKLWAMNASIAGVSVRIPRGVTIVGTRPFGFTVK